MNDKLYCFSVVVSVAVVSIVIVRMFMYLMHEYIYVRRQFK